MGKNLSALAASDPFMARRLCWPVCGDHVRLGHAKPSQPGPAPFQIRHRGVWHALEPSEICEAAADAVEAFCSSNSACPVLVFGAGAGVYLSEVLRRLPARSVVHVYDRDPWLLRLALQRQDFAARLKAGRLRLHLGTDLSRLRTGRDSLRLFCHPVLSRLYGNEMAYFREPRPESKSGRCFIGEGELFVDDVAETLRDLGIDVLPWLPGHVSAEELSHQLADFEPAAVFQINCLHGLAGFVACSGKKFLAWEIDPVVDRLMEPAPPPEGAYIFTYNRQHIPAYEKAGFYNVSYLPLAANPSRRRPATLAAQDLATYGAPVSFVGASMTAEAEKLRNVFLALPKEMIECSGGISPADVFEDVRRRQAADPDAYRIPKLLDSFMPNRPRYFSCSGTDYDIDMLAAETAAADRRMALVAALAPYGVDVWGDPGWKRLGRAGVRYRGWAGHNKELNKIYTASGINVDINRIFQQHIVTMRVFDALSCGGFLIAERNEALKELFDLDREIVSYRTRRELVETVGHFFDRPKQRSQYAREGRRAVRSRHSMAARVKEMLETAQVDFAGG